MKKSISLIAILLSLALAGSAQMTQPAQTPATQTPATQQQPQQVTPSNSRMQPANAPAELSNTLPDGYILKDGKVQQVKGGVIASTAITQNMKLDNGTWIMPDGTVKDANNKTSKLVEGQEIQTDGKLLAPPPHD